MPAARRSSSDRVTIDSSPRRRLSQNVDTESAPGNLPAMPTTAIALGGKASLLLVTLGLLPFAALRLAAVLRPAAVLLHAAGLDHERRLRFRSCPAAHLGRVDG